MRENFGRENLANLANHEPFAKIFLTNIHRYTENLYGICTDCCLFAKFFLTNSFYLNGSSKVYDMLHTMWEKQLYSRYLKLGHSLPETKTLKYVIRYKYGLYEDDVVPF